MIESSESTACAHLFMHVSLEVMCRKGNKKNLSLIGEATEVLAVRVPRNKVCIPGTKLRVFLITRDLPPLESKACINTK